MADSGHGLGGVYYPEKGEPIGWKNGTPPGGHTSLMATRDLNSECKQGQIETEKEKCENIMDMDTEVLEAKCSSMNSEECHDQINETIEKTDQEPEFEFESPKQRCDEPNDDQDKKSEENTSDSITECQIPSEDQRKKTDDHVQNSPTRVEYSQVVKHNSRGHISPSGSHSNNTSLFYVNGSQSYKEAQCSGAKRPTQPPLAPNYKRNVGLFKKIEDCKPKLVELSDPQNLLFGRKANFMISIPIGYNPFPIPYPSNAKAIQDHWDGNHVKMPYSKSNVNEWKQIKAVFAKGMTSAQQLEESIKRYNKNYSKLNVLRAFFSNFKWTQFESTIKFMADLARNLPHIVTKSVPLLKQRESSILFLSQHQIACLLANAFFCTFPRRSRINPEYKNFPPINFYSLFSSEKDDELKIKVEKLKCIFAYFEQIKENMPKGVVTFERRGCADLPKIYWHMSDIPLTGLKVKQGTIELEGKGFTEVDFANKYIGGGVLNSGCVQEELRFLMCPELIISRLFTEVLLDGETLIITGCAQYNQISGYSSTFKFIRSLKQSHLQRDVWGRYYSQVVAIDAQSYRTRNDPKQFEQDSIERTLNKAYIGFYDPNTYSDVSPAISSGKWGSGAFNGDPYLVCLLQLMAASQLDRNLILFIQNNNKFKQEIESFYKFVIKKNVTIKDIYIAIVDYSKSSRHYSKNIIEFISDRFNK